MAIYETKIDLDTQKPALGNVIMKPWKTLRNLAHEIKRFIWQNRILETLSIPEDMIYRFLDKIDVPIIKNESFEIKETFINPRDNMIIYFPPSYDKDGFPIVNREEVMLPEGICILKGSMDKNGRIVITFSDLKKDMLSFTFTRNQWLSKPEPKDEGFFDL